MVTLTKHTPAHRALEDRGAALDLPVVGINIDREHSARFPYFINDDGSTPPLVNRRDELDIEWMEISA